MQKSTIKRKINMVYQNKVNHLIKNFILLFSLFIILPMLLTGCTSAPSKKHGRILDGVNNTTRVEEKYDTQVQGVIKEIDTVGKTITYFDMDYGTDYILNYNGATNIVDKYEQPLAISQIKIGEIVDLYYANETNKLIELKISKDAWEYKGVKNLVIDKTNKIMSISEQKYKYSDTLVIASNEDLINLIDINNQDELIIKGKDEKIYSILIDKGHGYIRLMNYKDFVGGTVEVGYHIITPVVEDMLIVSKEGNYKITLENGELVGSKNIHVLRNEEVVVDMADFKLEPVKKSSVEFDITPYAASLYIDKKLTEYDEEVVLSYGKHTVMVALGGYITYTGVLTIDKPTMNITIDLVEASNSVDNETVENNATQNTSTANNTTTYTGSNTSSLSKDTTNSNTTTSNGTTSSNSNDTNVSSATQNLINSLTEKVDKEHKIYLEKPVGADAYLDGVKVGVVPVSIEKKIGTHTVTFSKEGCSTKSYTIEVIDDSQDIYFSFPEMTLSN